jgi:hypothetical protein
MYEIIVGLAPMADGELCEAAKQGRASLLPRTAVPQRQTAANRREAGCQRWCDLIGPRCYFL